MSEKVDDDSVAIRRELPCDYQADTFLSGGFQCLDHFTVRHLIGVSVVDGQQSIIDLETTIFLGHAIGLKSTDKESTARHLRIDLTESNTVSSLRSFR